MGVHYRTNGGRPLSTFGGRIVVQMGDASATLGEHTTTDVVIVCYNYHSAGLRVSGLPKMALWYICTFGLWYIWTLAHLYLLFFPIVVQMGDALSYRWGMLP